MEDFFVEDHMVFRGNSRRQQGKRGDHRQLTDNYLPMTEDRKILESLRRYQVICVVKFD